MTARSLLLRVGISLGVYYIVAATLITFINEQYVRAQAEYLEASKQTLLLSREMEQVAQSIVLGESTSDLQGQLRRLSTRSLPFDCCRDEFDIYLAAISQGAATEWSNGVSYRISKASEQFLRALNQRIIVEGEQLDTDKTARDIFVPLLALILASIGLLTAFHALNRRVISPIRGLTEFVRSGFRGAPSKEIESLESAVSEIRYLQESMDSFIMGYRESLQTRGQKATEMAQTSDALERQFQTLIETSEKPIFTLDAAGAIRTWNKHMVAITGISKAQASRLMFSEQMLAGSSETLFNDAFRVARRGETPDELECRITLAGGRRTSLRLQLSPQIESTLGVNRVLAVVDTTADNDGSAAKKGGPLKRSSDAMFAELIASMEWLLETEGALTKPQIARQRVALAKAIEWIGTGKYIREQSILNLSELVTHFESTLRPRLLDRNLNIDLNVVVDGITERDYVMVRGNAGAILLALEKVSQNAIEAIEQKPPKQGQISIRLSLDGNALVRIAIADNGAGILVGQEDTIFEPFFTTKASDGQAGLGLTHTRDLIENMSGRVFARDSGGRGLEIIIELPAIG